MKKTIFVLLLGIIIGFFLRDLLMEKPAVAKIVTIKSRNLEFKVETHAATVDELLEEQGIESDPNLRIHPNDSNSGHSDADLGHSGRLISHGMTIEVKKPLEVIINDGGNSNNIITTDATVRDLIYKQKIALAITDRVTPDLNVYLAQGMEIKIDRIVDLEITENTEIPFGIELQYDPAAAYGHEAVLSEGVKGEKEQLFLITYKNGAEIKRKLLSEKVVKKPIKEIKKFGTMIKIQETKEGSASWYAYRGCICAAHPFYEFGRFLRVTSLENGKSVIVRINDRGPDLSVHPDRVIDLDSTAFKELAPLGTGTIGVRVELIKN